MRSEIEESLTPVCTMIPMHTAVISVAMMTYSSIAAPLSSLLIRCISLDIETAMLLVVPVSASDRMSTEAETGVLAR